MESEALPPVVYMFGGPNGAGKSTFYNSAGSGYPQVNADVLLAQNPSLTLAGAAVLQVRRIKQLLAERATFSTENNLYKPNNYNLVREYQALGYWVGVIYVSLASAAHCKERVAGRVAQGGHNIPEKQIEERFAGGLETLKLMYRVPNRLLLLDNTSPSRELNRQPLLTVEHGRITQEAAALPPWVAAIRDHIRHEEAADALPG